MSLPILRFNDITFSYTQEEKIIDNLSFSIEPGTITAVLGPNGVGKTTFLNIAMGYLRPQEGEVILQGSPFTSYSRRTLGTWMGLVPQSEHIPFEYSLIEYVLHGRAPYLKPLEMPKQQDCHVAAEALARVGLEGFEDRSIVALSGGERQLLMIARALAQEPKILFFDEPTSHLDLANKKRLIGLIKKLSDSGVTIMFTTHEPEVVIAAADHIALMGEGKMLYTGTVEETFTEDNLSRIYGVPVKLADAGGVTLVIWHGVGIEV